MTSSLDRSEPLRLPPADRGWTHKLWLVLGFLMFGAVLVAVAVYTAPALVSDWQVRDAARPVPDARVTDGKCSSKIVVHICDATLNVGTPSGTVSRRINYVFTGIHVGDYSIRVMADPARPALATTDLGLDRLWNRTITLVTIVSVLLAFTVLPLVTMIRNRRMASVYS